MKKSIIAFLSLGLFAGATITSCQDMMTVDTGDKAYTNAQDTLYSYLGIMRCMQDVAERQVILGEIRGDLVTSTDYTTDTLFAISNFDDPKDQTCSMLQVSDYYNVINNCNFYIQNADTNAIKSNIKYMIPEYAQVKAIRAWAYLQLVKNYGAVPYINEPVSSLDVIKNFDYNANLVDKNTLVDRLIKDGLVEFVDTRYPQYGSTSSTYGAWNNGYTDISARMCYIPIRVVLGDLYLLRGSSASDFETAARYYYDFLKNETTPLYRQYCDAVSNMRTGAIEYTPRNQWGLWGTSYNYNATTNEVISLIPGSANAGLGKMLTRVSDIFGYTTSSSQSSDASADGDGGNKTDANGSEQYEATGNISVVRNWKRQYAPSHAYQGYNEQFQYINYQSTSGQLSDLKYSIIDNCDARYGNSIERNTYEGEAYPLCAKAAKGAQFFYTIPIYRKSLIWLRLAEAINRAGYPEFAFAILKDGLNQYSIPTIREFADITHIITNINGTDYYSMRNDEAGLIAYRDTLPGSQTYYYFDAEGNFTEFPERVGGVKWVANNDTTYSNRLYYGDHESMNYVTDSVRLKKFNQFLNFSDDIWNSTYGIHAKGAGFGNWTSSNTGEVSTNISGSRDKLTYDYATELLKRGVDITKSATDEQIINAVEDLIVDELALETAFEGNRFTDLVRIAEHKNASGFDGTEWLAKKIASRNIRPATLTTAVQGEFDNSIYSKLKNTKNWYFSLPAWSVK